jgi:hypothetical protein
MRSTVLESGETMRKLIGIVLTSVLLAGLVVSGAAADNPTSATKCPLTTKEQRSLGASYVTSLAVEGITCDKGKRITVAFNNCRTSGDRPQGRCHHKVAHYTCTERRYAKVPGGYTSAVTCTWGSKRVLITYTQNT